MPRAPRRSQTADAQVAVVAGESLADSATPRTPLSVIGDNDSDMTIFQQPWWLEAVSDNRYSSVTAGDGDNAYLW